MTEILSVSHKTRKKKALERFSDFALIRRFQVTSSDLQYCAFVTEILSVSHKTRKKKALERFSDFALIRRFQVTFNTVRL